MDTLQPVSFPFVTHPVAESVDDLGRVEEYPIARQYRVRAGS
ncbi:hypothetical protein [Lysobacter gummosus]